MTTNNRKFIFKAGSYTNCYFNDFLMMSKSAINWDHLCTYELLPTALNGHHQVLQLNSMQLSFSKRDGGVMHDALAPKDCLSIAIVQRCDNKACFGGMKLHRGDIIIFDDSKHINLISNDVVEVIIISIPKKNMPLFVKKVSPYLGHYIHDTNYVLSDLLNEILNTFVLHNTYQKADKNITDLFLKLLNNQTPKVPKLTKGEKIALEIREKIYLHMDAKIDIRSFALEYNISEQTLQNSFKSIFGFTPKLFFRLLKLNLVHHELKTTCIKQNTIQKIANKWGFTHMGYFSSYYTKLFGVNPIDTLKKEFLKDDSMTKPCTGRKEEI